MSELFERLKKNKKFACSERALETVCYFTNGLGDLSINDSDGTMSVLMDHLKDLWNRVLRNANEDFVQLQRRPEMHSKVQSRLVRSIQETPRHD